MKRGRPRYGQRVRVLDRYRPRADHSDPARHVPLGASGSGSLPSSYLIAISHELAAETT